MSQLRCSIFFNDTATTEIYTLSLHDALPISSPIRRYPDTIVHRLLTRYQQGARSANEKHCEELCEHCSDMELVAQNAERDSIKYKMVEFMADKLGQRSEEHTSELQSRQYLVCRLLLEKKKNNYI